MSWIRMNMKFPGTCTVCKKKVDAGEPGYWAKGMGVKHEACAEQASELECIACGGPAGCPKCELADTCDLEAVSQLCVCPKCLDDAGKDPMGMYGRHAARRFGQLNLKIQGKSAP